MKKIVLTILILVLIGGLIYFLQKNKTIFPAQKGTPSATINQETGGLTNYSEEGISLEVSQPKNKAVVNNPTLTITGKTSPTAEVFINDLQLTADAQGSFSAPVILEEGENVIVVVANDNQGNFAEQELIVTLETTE